MSNIVIVADRESLRDFLRKEVAAPGDCSSLCLPHAGPGSITLPSQAQAVLLGASDGAGAQRALAVAEHIRTHHPACQQIVLVTASCSEEIAIQAIRAGVTELIKLPAAEGEIAGRVGRLMQDLQPLARPAEVPHRLANHCIVGEGEEITAIRNYIMKVAPSNSTVLITGETGTGKELVADLVHRHSRRGHKRLVVLNCAAVPDTLLESELFGHERGAFTGAHSAQEGKLGLASGGTLFLDEIGEMSPYAQAKMLRALESHEIYRLGARSGTIVDVRFVAATNQHLEKMVEEGSFRKDLFYRLNVARVRIPALRNRKQDIPLLVSHYIDHYNSVFDRAVQGIQPDTLRALAEYNWPGNIRELKNVLEAMFLSSAEDELNSEHLPYMLRRGLPVTPAPNLSERATLLQVLRATKWNKSRAAERLNWSRMTLYRKMAKYQLSDSGDIVQPDYAEMACE